MYKPILVHEWYDRDEEPRKVVLCIRDINKVVEHLDEEVMCGLARIETRGGTLYVQEDVEEVQKLIQKANALHRENVKS